MVPSFLGRECCVRHLLGQARSLMPPKQESALLPKVWALPAASVLGQAQYQCPSEEETPRSCGRRSQARPPRPEQDWGKALAAQVRYIRSLAPPWLA